MTLLNDLEWIDAEGIDIPDVLTPLNWRPEFALCRTVGESVTVPDQAYTVAQLMERHSRGLLTDLEIGREALYDEDASLDSPDMQKVMDGSAIDSLEFVEASKRATRLERERSKAEAVKVAAAAKAAELAAAVESELAKRALPDSPKP